MLVAIKKYKFHMIKTEFYKFIIKLKKNLVWTQKKSK